MTRVGLLKKPGSEDDTASLESLSAWLRGGGYKVVVLGDPASTPADDIVVVDESEIGRACDLLVVLGGDGTLLRACQLVADDDVPLLGVNLGNLGFLTPFDRSEAQVALQRALEGELPLEERMRIVMRLYRRAEGLPAGRQGATARGPASPGPDASTLLAERSALNDVAITRQVVRPLDFRASLDEDPIAEYKADGIIVATPTGSTAYNLACGGPVLMPGLAAMAVTPISPHALTHRPVVVPASGTVRIELISDAYPAILSVDGNWEHPFVFGDYIEVVRAQKPLKLFRPRKSHFEIMREKLAWGTR